MGGKNTGIDSMRSYNKGFNNIGRYNKGDKNIGSRNVGNRNNGFRNIGDNNIGAGNIGFSNIGHSNLGHSNNGFHNNGNNNSGLWNSGNFITGYFNTVAPDDILVFNKLVSRSILKNIDFPKWLYFDLVIWVDLKDMTPEEKDLYPTHETTGGYLKSYEYKEAVKLSWDKATHEDRMKTYALPNFDADVAQEIFGIDFAGYLANAKICSEETDIVEEFDIITINGKRFKLVEIQD